MMIRFFIISITSLIKFLDNMVAPFVLLSARLAIAFPIFESTVKKLMNYSVEINGIKSFFFISPHIIFIISFVIFVLYSISLIAGLATRISAIIFATHQFYTDWHDFGWQELLSFSANQDIMLIAAVFMLIIFGPGTFSFDSLIKRRWMSANDF